MHNFKNGGGSKFEPKISLPDKHLQRVERVLRMLLIALKRFGFPLCSVEPVRVLRMLLIALKQCSYVRTNSIQARIAHAINSVETV